MIKKKVYPVNRTNLFEYRTNQKDIIFQGSKLNKYHFPEYYPTRNASNALVFISFVDAEIYDLQGNLVSEEKATFDILDTEKFNPESENAQKVVRYVSALLSPEYRVKGGVYVKGKYYTGQMKKPYAQELYQAFMAKYFSIQDEEYIKKSFSKNEDGYHPFWPVFDKETNQRIVFTALDAKIMEKESGKVVKENINFHIISGRLFDLNNEEDKIIADTIFAMLNRDYVVSGFYFRGKLIPNNLSNSMKMYLEKGFIKKNFTLEHLNYLYEKASTNEKGELYFFPMTDKEGKKVMVSLRNGVTPFGKEYENFDINSTDVFDPREVTNRYKLQIVERIILKQKDFSGSLYLDGILVPGRERKSEVIRRKNKVEKELKVRIDGDDDYMKIFDKFTTDDREKMLIMSDYHRESYPRLEGKVEKKSPLYNKKERKPIFIFDRVNILNEDGEYLLKEDYSASYDEAFKANETEVLILKNLFKKHSLLRGGVYYKGTNINRVGHFIGIIRFSLMKAFIKKCVSIDEAHVIFNSQKEVGCPYKMDKKSKMFIHWPTFDSQGRETLLSVVDSDVWFKVGRHTVKAANDMNFNIYGGEIFGLVGESGSGKTTISRAILGINKLRKGGIYWKGKLISSGLSRSQAKATKKNIQMIFQDPAASLNERANIDYIVSEGLYSFHLFKNKEERLSKVSTMLREVGLLPEHLSRYPHEFSGGQRQRIGIARALVIEPELVLADEPISALDVSIRAQVLNLLKKLQKSDNLTYLFIAHDLSIIRYISDRIAVMHNGYIVELGNADEIYSHPLHPYTKSLLTAIPQPDPKTKDVRKKIVYEQGNIVYGECTWTEFRPGHFVLVNDELKEKISKEIK